MPDRLVTLTESDWLNWLADRMPCPICQEPMQQITAIRGGYKDVRWACKSCGFNVNRSSDA